MARSSLWRKDFPIEIFSALTIFAAILSFMFVCVTLIRHWKAVSVEQKIFCFVILLGEVSNALICGALSGPHEALSSTADVVDSCSSAPIVLREMALLTGGGGLVVSGPWGAYCSGRLVDCPGKAFNERLHQPWRLWISRPLRDVHYRHRWEYSHGPDRPAQNFNDPFSRSLEAPKKGPPEGGL